MELLSVLALLAFFSMAAEKSNPDEGLFGAGAHTNWGMMTLLATDDVPGLQVFVELYLTRVASQGINKTSRRLFVCVLGLPTQTGFILDAGMRSCAQRRMLYLKSGQMWHQLRGKV